MGRPTINRFGVNEYVDGSPLIINDSNILGEIAGNISNRDNVQAFNNLFTMTFYWNKGLETYSFGNDAYVGAIRMPVRFTVLEAQIVGYATETAANYQFSQGAVNAGANNEVTVTLKVYNELGEEEAVDATDYSALIDTPGQQEKIGDISGIKGVWAGGAASPDPLSLEVSQLQMLTIEAKINSSANVNFNPYLYVTVIGTMEHKP